MNNTAVTSPCTSTGCCHSHHKTKSSFVQYKNRTVEML